MMKLQFFTLLLFAACFSCNQNDRTNPSSKSNAKEVLNELDLPKSEKKVSRKPRVHFSSVAEVVNQDNQAAWVALKDSTASLSLHFNLSSPDTVSVCFTTECWLRFPYKLDEDKIMVYWDVLIDSKYDFDIVKAIEKVDKRFIGKPFMELELLNDSTLQTHYPIPEIRRKINACGETRTLLPDTFSAKDFFL